MSDNHTPPIWKQFVAMYQDIGKRVEAYFNKNLEYPRYFVKDISSHGYSTYGQVLKAPLETTLLNVDVRFEVKLGDIAHYNFATAIECRVMVRPDGELVIDGIRRTERIQL